MPPSPLTPPIYETSTFVFDNAAEVVAYNEGRSSKYLYSRYGNPTLASVERQLAALDRAEAALIFSSGMGAITTTIMAHARAGDEVVCSAAIYGGTLHLLNDVLVKFGVRPRFVSLEELAEPERVDQRRHAPPLVRVADQPDAALRGRPADRGRLPDRRDPVGHRQHVREPDQPAAALARHRPVDAERHEVSERPQRRDRRRGDRRRRPGCADRAGAPAARNGDGSVSRVRAGPRPENAAAADRAAQRERARGRAVPRRRQTRLLRLLSRSRVASRSRDRQAADDRLRRHGVLRS